MKTLLATALALTVSSSASAIVSVTLTQIGGTYSASLGATASDTLILEIGYDITGASTASLIDPAIDVNNVAVLAGGTETGFAAWGGGAASLAPLIQGTDIKTVAPGQLDGWEKGGTTAGGAPCVFGDCTILGTVTLHLTGLGGVIDTGSIVQPAQFGTIISTGATDITGSSFLGTFTVVPEPTTASLLGLGLLGLTVAGRKRN
jgi:hypothetical protein